MNKPHYTVADIIQRKPGETVAKVIAMINHVGEFKNGETPEGTYSTQNIKIVDANDPLTDITVKLMGFNKIPKERKGKYIGIESVLNGVNELKGVLIEPNPLKKGQLMLVVKKSEGAIVGMMEEHALAASSAAPATPPASPAAVTTTEAAKPAAVAPTRLPETPREPAAPHHTPAAPATPTARPAAAPTPTAQPKGPKPQTRSEKVVELRRVGAALRKLLNVKKMAFEYVEEWNAERLKAQLPPLTDEGMHATSNMLYLSIVRGDIADRENNRLNASPRLPVDSWLLYRDDMNEKEPAAVKKAEIPMPPAASENKKAFLAMLMQHGDLPMKYALEHNYLIEGQELIEWPEKFVPKDEANMQAFIREMLMEFEPVETDAKGL